MNSFVPFLSSTNEFVGTKTYFLPKVLIIRFSSIGDIVLTSPVIRCLKLQIGVEIHYLTKKPFKSILEVNPHISKVYTIEKKISEVSRALRKERYDFIIDLHHNLRSFLVKWSMPFVKSYSFKKLNFEKWLMVNLKINRLPNKHIVDRYLDSVKPLGVENDDKGLDFFLNEKATIKQFPPLEVYRGREASFIALPIGAGRNTKALTIEKIVNICQSSDYPIVLLGGKAEIEKGKEIEKLLQEFPPPDPLQRRRVSYEKESVENNIEFEDLIENYYSNRIINLVGKCSLLESAAIVKNAAVVLTGDTGLMHIAAAFHKPIVSIWGNTVPEFGMYPYYPKGIDLNRTMEVPKLPCRPCSKIGFADCPKGHFKCIEELNISKITEQLKTLLATP